MQPEVPEESEIVRLLEQCLQEHGRELAFEPLCSLDYSDRPLWSVVIEALLPNALEVIIREGAYPWSVDAVLSQYPDVADGIAWELPCSMSLFSHDLTTEDTWLSHAAYEGPDGKYVVLQEGEVTWVEGVYPSLDSAIEAVWHASVSPFDQNGGAMLPRLNCIEARSDDQAAFQTFREQVLMNRDAG